VWLAGFDRHPSKGLGLGDLGGEDGKAARELADSLSSALAGKDGKEPVETFSGEHGKAYSTAA
jgi:hypothetical protein